MLCDCNHLGNDCIDAGDDEGFFGVCDCKSKHFTNDPEDCSEECPDYSPEVITIPIAGLCISIPKVGGSD